jgi:glycosyltransferase involved in cell wall biosynthesis
MSASPPSRPPIPRVPDDVPRPLWSVMVPTYNSTRYLRHTLASVLAQDPGPDQMQIEVIDDSSSDDPSGVVDELSPDRIGYHRQPENVGHIRNFNTCIERAHGHLVHILHGDDAVRDGFYRTMRQPFDDHPEIGAAFCRYISMDSDGNWETIAPLEPDGRGILENWLERIALGQRIQPPTIVVRRSVYETIGGFDSRAGLMGEDWEMWVRIAGHFAVWYEPEPLAVYRVHGSSITSDISVNARDVRELRDVVEINRAVLPPDRADALSREARAIGASTAIRRAGRLLHNGHERAARAQVREALNTSRSPAVLERFAFFCLLWVRHRLKELRRGGG